MIGFDLADLFLNVFHLARNLHVRGRLCLALCDFLLKAFKAGKGILTQPGNALGQTLAGLGSLVASDQRSLPGPRFFELGL